MRYVPRNETSEPMLIVPSSIWVIGRKSLGWAQPLLHEALWRISYSLIFDRMRQQVLWYSFRPDEFFHRIPQRCCSYSVRDVITVRNWENGDFLTYKFYNVKFYCKTQNVSGLKYLDGPNEQNIPLWGY